MKHRVEYVGSGRAPVLVIEDAWPDLDGLLDLAAGRTDYARTSLYYPGLRSPAPREYAIPLLHSVLDLIRETFHFKDEVVITDSSFSLVTTPAENLVPFQRVPHYDSPDQNRLALLHYLCDSGGTSFYRHRSSGIEVITDEIEERYIRLVNEEVKQHGMPPARYVDGDSELFERLARYDAVRNRLLIYRGSMLHSVNVPHDFVPDTNPRTGRLTVNTFTITRPAPG